jgi:hypothetical protein
MLLFQNEKGESAKTYTHEIGVKKLYEEVISKVDFITELNLSHLKDSKYVPK